MDRIGGAFYSLVGLALFVALAAWWVIGEETQRQSQKNFAPVLLFSNLAERIEEVGAIRMEIGQGLAGVKTITFVRPSKQAGIFQVKEASNFFADPILTNRLLHGMAALKAIAPRAADKMGHQKLGLVAPENLGPAIRISFYGFPYKRGNKTARKKIAALLVGKRPEEIGEVFGLSSIYARRDGEAQSFLVRGALPLRVMAKEWLDLGFLKNMLNKKNGETFIVSKMQVSIRRQAAWMMQRRQPKSDFVLTNRRRVPLRGVFDKSRLAVIAEVPKNLTFLNVRPVRAFRFGRPQTVIYESFSGLALIFEIIQTPEGFWAKINARATSSGAQTRAKKLQTYLEGFAFLIPSAMARKMILSPAVLKR